VTRWPGAQRLRPGAGSEAAWARGGLGHGRPRAWAALAQGGEVPAATGGAGQGRGGGGVHRQRWPGATGPGGGGGSGEPRAAVARCAGGGVCVCVGCVCGRGGGVTVVRGPPLISDGPGGGPSEIALFLTAGRGPSEIALFPTVP
jgi:hypothetical protein